MNGRIGLTATLVLISLLSVVVADRKPPKSNQPATDDKPKAKPIQHAGDKRFHKRLLEIAGEYRKYGRFDAKPRFALLDCRSPSEFGGVPRVSSSKDKRSHGEKLYYIYAKHGGAYRSIHTKYGIGQEGQVVVKEAWHGIPVDSKAKLVRTKVKVKGKTVQRMEFTAANSKGQRFRVGKQTPLFVMYKLPRDTPGTDYGWVYGTLSPDGRQVTGAGRIESCMYCHKSAPHLRLFGIKDLRIYDLKKKSKNNDSKK